MKILIFTLFYLSSAWTLRRIPENFKPVPRPRLIGGQAATAGQFPWIAAIYKTTAEGRYFCGGSIFSEQWIMTAAQCIEDATSFTIQVGSTQLQGSDPNRVTVTATTYFINPKYDSATLGPVHDIGLIKLDSPLTLTDYIQPVIMLETMNPIYNGVQVTVIGWGPSSDNGDIVNDLQYVELQILGQTECKAYYGDQLWGSMCCTATNSNQGPCVGDTGGPLMVAAPVGDHTIQAGIVSFFSANGCESTDPKGYTRTDAYYWWMREVIKNNTDVV